MAEATLVDEPAGAVMAAMKIIEDLMGPPTIPGEEILAAIANEEDRAFLRQGFATLIYSATRLDHGCRLMSET